MIYRYKTDRINKIWNLIDLKDCNINAREVIKDQIDFKLDLGKTEKGNKISKSKDQTSAI